MSESRGWFEPSPRADPVVPAPEPARPPTVAARAVIVYQDRPRRPWRLWVFTLALVALTVGVVLGQTVAYEPVYRPAAGAEAVPAGSTSPAQPWPDAAHRVTAPLGSVRTRLLEIAGATAVLRVRSEDLGETLLDIATTDRGALPVLTDGARGSRLELIRTGEAGTAGAEIRLNAKVAWTLRLTGGATERNIDMRAGGLRGIAVDGGTAHVVLQLGKPKGTVPLTMTGPVGELVVHAGAGAPVRFRLGGGAGTAVVDGNTHRGVEAGAEFAPDGWQAARNRYDVVTSGVVTSVVAASRSGG
ncbi:hypothetical protein ACIBSW_21090 [Actinoplanes sp. NPDC049668]|uniref:hypothetical protein n=1 Tax=unclassified Actinoplanes TaxID=2626549 RepID=UPI0033AFBD38